MISKPNKMLKFFEAKQNIDGGRDQRTVYIKTVRFMSNLTHIRYLYS